MTELLDVKSVTTSLWAYSCFMDHVATVSFANTCLGSRDGALMILHEKVTGGSIQTAIVDHHVRVILLCSRLR